MASIEMKGDQVMIADGQWGASLFCSRQPALYPYPLHRRGVWLTCIEPFKTTSDPLCLEAPQASGKAPVQDTFGAAIHASK
jgi:hypothetical protein